MVDLGLVLDVSKMARTTMRLEDAQSCDDNMTYNITSIDLRNAVPIDKSDQVFVKALMDNVAIKSPSQINAILDLDRASYYGPHLQIMHGPSRVEQGTLEGVLHNIYTPAMPVDRVLIVQATVDVVRVVMMPNRMVMPQVRRSGSGKCGIALVSGVNCDAPSET